MSVRLEGLSGGNGTLTRSIAFHDSQTCQVLRRDQLETTELCISKFGGTHDHDEETSAGGVARLGIREGRNSRL